MTARTADCTVRDVPLSGSVIGHIGVACVFASLGSLLASLNRAPPGPAAWHRDKVNFL